MSNSLVPEAIPKEMKTEDEILAQMRAAQGDATTQNLTFMSDAVSAEDAFTAGTNIAPNLEELQKLIESDIHVIAAQRAAAAAAAEAAEAAIAAATDAAIAAATDVTVVTAALTAAASAASLAPVDAAADNDKVRYLAF